MIDKFSYSVRTLSLIWFSLLLTSCVRFTPAIGKNLASSGMLGDKAFHNLDVKNNHRLKSLISSRENGKSLLADGSYKIGSEDLVDIKVFGVDELSGEQEVRANGNLTLPLIGEHPAINKTAKELELTLSQAYAEYIKSPQIRVLVKNYGAHKVSVLGQVYNPGSYSLKKENYSLLELLSESGGRKENASDTIVLIPAEPESQFRESSRARLNPQKAAINVSYGSEFGAPSPKQISKTSLDKDRQGIKINFSELIGASSKVPVNIPLRSGDVIVIPESGSIHVSGEVKTPGSFPANSEMTLLGAIASAGGLRYPANIKNIEVVRNVEGDKQAVLKVNLKEINKDRTKDIKLKNGDVVNIPSARMRFAVNQIFEAVNKILHIGVSR